MTRRNFHSFAIRSKAQTKSDARTSWMGLRPSLVEMDVSTGKQFTNRTAPVAILGRYSGALMPGGQKLLATAVFTKGLTYFSFTAARSFRETDVPALSCIAIQPTRRGSLPSLVTTFPLSRKNPSQSPVV